MIAQEIIITLAAAALTFTLAIIIMISAKRIWAHVLFGMLVLVGFLGWAYYLMQQNMLNWALASAGFALLMGFFSPLIASIVLRNKALKHSHVSPDKEKTTKSHPVTLPEASLKTSAEIPAQPISTVPEDSILRRHYLAHLQAEKEALTNPYPTCSILKRHYDSMQVASLNLKPSSGPSAPIHKKPADIPTIVKSEKEKIMLPEDSILKRHFLTELRNAIENDFSPRPTDSILKRHYDAMIESEFERRLAGLSM